MLALVGTVYIVTQSRCTRWISNVGRIRNDIRLTAQQAPPTVIADTMIKKGQDYLLLPARQGSSSVVGTPPVKAAFRW